MSAIEIVQTFLTQSFGWQIEIDEKTFEKKITRISIELGYKHLDSFIESLKNNQNSLGVLQVLAREFSVGESYFFRDPQFFDYLEQTIIPQIIHKNEHTLSIWSVGCSGGEELYSIAMILKNTIPDIGMWNLYLLGTDINPHAIYKAKEGVFNDFSFRKIPKQYMSFFKPIDHKYQIDPLIKKMVSFKYHNIIKEPYSLLPPNGQGFDLILIKNVLIYFEPQNAKAVVKSLFSFVKEGGYLTTTPAEYGMGIFNFPHSVCSQRGYSIQKVSAQNVELPLPAVENSFEENLPDSYEEIVTHLVESIPEDVSEKISEESLLDKNLYYYNALKLLELGEYKMAKISLRQALYLDKDLVMAHIVLGNILIKEGKIKSAMKQIDNAKSTLQRMQPQELVELSDGIMASDLLSMIDSIRGEKFE